MVDLKEAIGSGMEVRPIANMPGHETNEVFFDNLEIPAENLIGTEGRGFYHILDGLNAERTLIAAECIGDGYWFVDKARAYAGERIVFDRPIGQNQGVQFPIARAYVNVEAANLMRFEACRRFDAGLDCGAQANMAKRPMPAGRRPMPASRRMAVLALRANTMSSASSARPGCIRWRQSRPT
jgi:acyl-CoA dehydrogenase